MASSQRLNSLENKPPQFIESPIIHPELSQGPRVLADDPRVNDSNSNSNSEYQRDSRSEVRTPELQTSSNGRASSIINAPEGLPLSPGQIPSFDWDEFEALYEQALAKANDRERELLHEFDSLFKYFNVWASAASAHDTERAVKRLQTRERYVRIAEQSLSQRKQHLTEVVRAFQSALALLSQN